MEAVLEQEVDRLTLTSTTARGSRAGRTPARGRARRDRAEAAPARARARARESGSCTKPWWPISWPASRIARTSRGTRARCGPARRTSPGSRAARAVRGCADRDGAELAARDAATLPTRHPESPGDNASKSKVRQTERRGREPRPPPATPRARRGRPRSGSRAACSVAARGCPATSSGRLGRCTKPRADRSALSRGAPCTWPRCTGTARRYPRRSRDARRVPRLDDLPQGERREVGDRRRPARSARRRAARRRCRARGSRRG